MPSLFAKRLQKRILSSVRKRVMGRAAPSIAEIIDEGFKYQASALCLAGVVPTDRVVGIIKKAAGPIAAKKPRKPMPVVQPPADLCDQYDHWIETGLTLKDFCAEVGYDFAKLDAMFRRHGKQLKLGAPARKAALDAK